MLVMVDRFTKMAHFTPYAKIISAEATTDLFLKNVVRIHGLLDDVTSDCMATTPSEIRHNSESSSNRWPNRTSETKSRAIPSVLT